MKSRFIKGVCGALLFQAVGATAQTPVAPVGRVSAVQAVVERRDATAPNWKGVRNGATLAAGDAIRTGKRSKADLNFSDGSLVRLGQLSSLEISGDRQARLTTGALLFSYLKPGRILAGTAAAEIKGTVGTITTDSEGNTEFALYTGSMDVVAGEARVPLTPGRAVVVRRDGQMLAMRAAAPLNFAGGVRDSELSSRPENSPYSGSGRQERIRERNSGSGSDDSLDKARSVVSNKGRSGNSGNGNGGGNSGGGLDDPLGTEDDDDDTGSVDTVVLRDGGFGTRTQALQISTATPGESSALAGAERAARRTQSGAYGEGTTYGGDVSLITAAGDGGVFVYGGQARLFASRGNAMAEVEFLPLRVRSKVAGVYRTDDFSAVSRASLTWRKHSYEAQAGRQQFYQGPVQATLFGSMLRAGGRDIMDAVRVSKEMNRGQRLELAYLVDAFPHNLPFRIAGSQSGFYARYAMQKPRYNVGLNVLHYSEDFAGLTPSTGMTLDFAVPLWRNRFEVYGEAGRDPLKRTLTTVGVTSPWLFQKTDLDVYLEYSNLRGTATVARPPAELALLVTRRMNDHLSLVGSVNRFYGTGTSATIGVSLGASAKRVLR